MGLFFEGFLFVFCLALHQIQARHFKQGVWRKVFTVDVVAPGASHHTAVDNELDCVRRCLQLEDCKTLAFHRHSATCWLYRHLVEYTTTGMASPGTDYFWRLSPSCPGELGYQLEVGICLKVYNSRGNRTEAKMNCGSDGAHLLIADSTEKIQAVLNRTSVRAWLGASDEDKEGDWRWVDGSVMQSQFWSGQNPSNDDGIEHFMELVSEGKFNDVRANATRVTACQIPLM